MASGSQWRGHEMYVDKVLHLWRYTEDDCLVKDDPQRLCRHCGIEATIEGHDGCLGTLPGVMNACCGHGSFHYAYIQFEDGRKTIREEEALEYMAQAIERKDNDSLHGKTQVNGVLVTKED